MNLTTGTINSIRKYFSLKYFTAAFAVTCHVAGVYQ